MDALRTAGIIVMVGFVVIMVVCALTGALAIDRTTRTLRGLW